MNHEPDQSDRPIPKEALQLPEGLQELLRDGAGAHRPLAEGEGGVESRVDEAVLNAARERLDAIEAPKTLRLSSSARVASGLGLAAAAVALMVWVGPRPIPNGQRVPGAASSDPVANLEDDDAEQYALARRSAAPADALADAEASEADAPSGPARMDRAPDAPLASMARSTDEARARSMPPNAVTIRDAYVLALALESGDAPDDGSWDANGDGAIDAKDVDALAVAAVALGDRIGLMPTPATPWPASELGVWLSLGTIGPTGGSVLR